jgi:hypothetical protein
VLQGMSIAALLGTPAYLFVVLKPIHYLVGTGCCRQSAGQHTEFKILSVTHIKQAVKDLVLTSWEPLVKIKLLPIATIPVVTRVQRLQVLACS